MVFRVTPNQFVSQTIRAAQLHGSRISLYQQQTTTGLKLTKPSDDPAGTKAILGVRASLNRMETELANINITRQRLGVANTELLDAQTLMVKVKDLVLQARQSVEPSERRTIADEVAGLRERIELIANTRYNGEYLFGGAASGAPPFAFDDAGRATYQGADTRGSTDIRPTTRVDVLYTGAEIFQAQIRGPTEFLGLTGAAAGTGVDSASGFGELQVIHTGTTYAGGSGVAAGTSSAGGDTIIGPAGAHTLTINDTSGTGASGTVALNGGNPVAFTSGDTNLQIVGPEGGIVYVDTTSITAGFSGTVNITANGALSTDGGATQVAIDFSANQQVIDGATGEVTHVDSTGILRTGSESIAYTGTANVFELLHQIESDLTDEANVGNADWHHAMSRHLHDLERMQDHLLDIVGDQAVSLENLDALEFRIGDLKLEQQRMAQAIESADITESVVLLQQEQRFLEYTLASTSRLFDISLVDFL